jgi:hypothetical protein
MILTQRRNADLLTSYPATVPCTPTPTASSARLSIGHAAQLVNDPRFSLRTRLYVATLMISEAHSDRWTGPLLHTEIARAFGRGTRTISRLMLSLATDGYLVRCHCSLPGGGRAWSYASPAVLDRGGEREREGVPTWQR